MLTNKLEPPDLTRDRGEELGKPRGRLAGSSMMVSQACYSSSDGKRYTRPYPLYFPSPSERRFPLSSHDTRSVTMADQLLDSDSTPQRKRIALAVRSNRPFPLEFAC